MYVPSYPNPHGVVFACSSAAVSAAVSLALLCGVASVVQRGQQFIPRLYAHCGSRLDPQYIRYPNGRWDRVIDYLSDGRILELPAIFPEELSGETVTALTIYLEMPGKGNSKVDKVLLCLV